MPGAVALPVAARKPVQPAPSKEGVPADKPKEGNYETLEKT
jgi:hypothetical protein